MGGVSCVSPQVSSLVACSAMEGVVGGGIDTKGCGMQCERDYDCIAGKAKKKE